MSLAQRIQPEPAISRKNQRQCQDCDRWFWAWSSTREQCYRCDPPTPDETRRMLAEIQSAATPAMPASLNVQQVPVPAASFSRPVPTVPTSPLVHRVRTAWRSLVHQGR